MERDDSDRSRRPPPQIKPWQKKKLFQKKVPRPKPRKLYRKPAAIEVDEKEIDFDFAEMEDAQGRVDRIIQEPGAPKPIPQGGDNISRKRKHLLFMNPGDAPIQAAMVSLNNNQPLPAWASPFRNQLGMSNGRLTWREQEGTILPFALHDKRRAKNCISIRENPQPSFRLHRNYTRSGRILTGEMFV